MGSNFFRKRAAEGGGERGALRFVLLLLQSTGGGEASAELCRGRDQHRQRLFAEGTGLLAGKESELPDQHVGVAIHFSSQHRKPREGGLVPNCANVTTLFQS